MQIIKNIISHNNKWWALPLILPLLLLPLARHWNACVWMSDTLALLLYFPLSLFTVLFLLYGWAALPGIVAAVIINYASLENKSASFITLILFLLPLIISWGGYRIFMPRRFAQHFWYGKTTATRIFWLVLCNASLFMMIYQLALFFGLRETPAALPALHPFSLHALVDFQAVLIGNLVGLPLFYLLIRLVRHPRYLRSFLSQLCAQCDSKVSKGEVALWFLLLSLVLYQLIIANRGGYFFGSYYNFSLLLPIMLWGSLRFGYLFIHTIWPPLLIIACHYYGCTLGQQHIYGQGLFIRSSSYGIFSLMIMFMARAATQQRIVHQRGRRLAFIDPLLHLPNLRALTRDLASAPWSALCLLRTPGLEVLGRNYGITLRIRYKQQLAAWIRTRLEADELVYQLSGHDMVLRLNAQCHRERIEELARHIQQFRFIWNGMPLQPPVGISYGFVRAPVNHLALLLGEMNAMADLSLETNLPESVQGRGANHMQNLVKAKIEMLNRLQYALDHHQFVLMAQLIEGGRGDSYHEILLRLPGEGEVLILPERFLPVAYEFGLSSKIDLLVLEKTLQFIDRWRKEMPASRFAINLTPASLCRTPFPDEVRQLLQRYQVEPWQIIFEIAEGGHFQHPELTLRNLSLLRTLGCRVAIDNFGTGYASYAYLKTIDIDMLKIDGQFIRNMVTSSLDYQLVESICHLAHMKNMQVVAESVANDAEREAARRLGVDYLQGYLIGRPQPLAALVCGAKTDEPE